MALTVKQYDALEHAITRGLRIAAIRRGKELVVVPERLILRDRREGIAARHPSTGAPLTLWLDDLEGVELVR